MHRYDVDKYIPLQDYAKYLNIRSDDIILISSDCIRMIWDARRHQASTDLNLLIDGLLDKLGDTGTILFPTYNWDFCRGLPFDYVNTPGMTGALGKLALKRAGFKRTKHPIYSFAVYGKHADELCNLNNKDSFSEDSPFAFLKHNHAINLIIDVSLKNSFTFMHYVEQCSNCVDYRFIKKFRGEYIDKNGTRSQREYSMFVRKLDLDVISTIDRIEPVFLSNKVEDIINVNSSSIKRIDLFKAYEIVLDDIKFNHSRTICTYKGQPM